jgi:4-oxalocrotonate tautomerase
MPFAMLHILEGRDEAKKAALIAAVTDAISTTLGAPRETIRVLIQEIPKTQWGVGGKTIKDLGK